MISKSKIIFLIPTMGYGSDMLYWRDFIEGLKNNVKNLMFFTSGDMFVPASIKNNVILKNSFRIRIYKSNKKNYKKIIHIISPEVILDIVKIRPNLIISSEFGILSIYAIILKLILGVELVLLVENRPSEGKNKAQNIYRRYVARYFCEAITNNISGSDYLINELKYKGKVNVFPYLTSDLSTHNTAEVHLHSSKGIIKFLYVGKLIKRKGVAALINAVNILPMETKARIRLSIVGDGPDFVYLQEIVNENYLTNIIDFVGKVEYRELHKYYNESDIFVLPTYSDYRALVTFEALSFDMVMLISKFDGSHYECVKDGVNGFIINPEDINDIATKIQYFVDNNDSIVEMKKSSRNIMRDFKKEKIIHNMNAYLEKKVDEK